MENQNNEIKSIYLFPQKDQTYGVTVSTKAPSIDGAIKLTAIRHYPVNVIYTRTDLNGSLCYEVDLCSDLADLLSTLDWCGRCRYTIHSIWDFDLLQTKEKALIELFHQASRFRLELITQDMIQLAKEFEDEDPASTLLTTKINEAEQHAASSAADNTPAPQEPVR